MNLLIEFSQFETELKGYEKQLMELQKVEVSDQSALEISKQCFFSLCIHIENFLKNSFSLQLNEHYLQFKFSLNHHAEFGKKKRSLEGRIRELNERTEEKRLKLRKICYLLSVSDASCNRLSDDELSERAMFSIRQKKKLLMMKLSQLNDGLYYPIKSLYNGNGLVAKREDEYFYVAKSLEKKAYMEMFGGISGDVYGRLTLEGQEFIEDVMLKSHNLNRALDQSSFLSEMKEEASFEELIQGRWESMIISHELLDILESLDLYVGDNTKLKNEILILMGRYHSLQSHKSKNVLSDDEIRLKESQIRFDLGNMLEDLKRLNAQHTLVSSASDMAKAG